MKVVDKQEKVQRLKALASRAAALEVKAYNDGRCARSRHFLRRMYAIVRASYRVNQKD